MPLPSQSQTSWENELPRSLSPDLAWQTETMPRWSAWFGKMVLQMEARGRNSFSNAKLLHLTIRASSKLIVNVDGKGMQCEDIGHKTREGLLLQNTQASIYRRPKELLQPASPSAITRNLPRQKQQRPPNTITRDASNPAFKNPYKGDLP